jgi:indole-3-glycerol phosphate synthase
MTNPLPQNPVTLRSIAQHKQQWLSGHEHGLPEQPPQGLVLASGEWLAALQRLAGQPCRLIAEIKPKSPSAGVLAQGFNMEQLIAAYSQHASAFSVLTDEPFFNGNFANLTQVTQQTGKPALCKDFVLDPRQIWQARASGAHAVLLIVKLFMPGHAVCWPTALLHQLHAACLQWGMCPVVEVQTPDELAMAQTLPGLQAILINNRNLDTFAMAMNTVPELMPHVPPGVLRIAASGYDTPQSIQVLGYTVDAVLMGSHLMRLLPDWQALDNALAALANVEQQR